MAKKKAPAKNRSTRKSSKDSGSNSGLILGIVMILVIGLAWYLKNNDGLPDFLQAGGKQEQTVESSKKPSNQVEKKESGKKSSAQKPVKTEPKTGKSSADKPAEEVEIPTDYDHYYYTTSFDFAWPAYSQDDLIVEHEGYTLAYDEDIEQPKWVAYRLTAENISKNAAQRKDNFRSDNDVRTESATLADYKGSGYDRGHLAPAADFSWSQSAMDGTFFLSNMSPQDPSFNRGIWKQLEEKVRDWGMRDKELFVVVGPIVEGGAKKIGKNKVAVPQKFYKIVLDISEPELKAIGFVMENKASTLGIMEYTVTIDSIEKITGLDFFPMIPDELEKKLESTINKNLWK
ncbi:MAG: DNA/RNA non-specific endonuclease [Imperialibacter sp.]|uniref:DNA/RNA non-specific endonuclease n=1 Tax=Imperialibacter sp. TaxID=2038411 RepID=UPI0032EBCF9D